MPPDDVAEPALEAEGCVTPDRLVSRRPGGLPGRRALVDHRASALPGVQVLTWAQQHAAQGRGELHDRHEIRSFRRHRRRVEMPVLHEPQLDFSDVQQGTDLDDEWVNRRGARARRAGALQFRKRLVQRHTRTSVEGAFGDGNGGCRIGWRRRDVARPACRGGSERPQHK